MENADAWSTPQEYGVICKLLHPLSCKELMWIFWQSAAEAFPVLFLTPPKKKKKNPVTAGRQDGTDLLDREDAISSTNL